MHRPRPLVIGRAALVVQSSAARRGCGRLGQAHLKKCGEGGCGLQCLRAEDAIRNMSKPL